MHIFLTGATGFIGQNLIPYLLSRECRITCLLRATSRMPETLRSQISVVIGDITDPGPQVIEALAGADAVVHLAGRLWADTYEEYARVNQHGVEAMIAAIHQSGVSLKRFVHISSLAAVGPARRGQPHTEEVTPAPISMYGRSKLAGEQALSNARFPWTILRFPAVYGPGDRATWQFFQLAAWHIRPNLLLGRAESSMIHVQDVSRAIWLAITRQANDRATYFVNDGQPIYRIRDITKRIADAVGAWTVAVPLPGGIIHAAEILLQMGRRVGVVLPRLTPDKLQELRKPAWTCSSERITAELGFQPQVSFDQGIKETIAWYRANGWL